MTIQSIRQTGTQARERLLCYLKKHDNALFFIVGIALALFVRWGMRDFKSGDQVDFYMPWYDYIVKHGGILALKDDFSDYTPIYLYFLTIITYINPGLPKLTAIKIIPVIFDFICAFGVYKIIALRYSNPAIAMLAFFAVLLSPTVIMNSAVWGQVDIIYTTWLVFCVYFLLRGRENAAFIAYGLAFATKQQAGFFAPLLFILLLKGKVSPRSFLFIPLVYVVLVIPAWIIGRPLANLLLIYVGQFDYYKSLSMNAPTIYQLLPNEKRFYDFFYFNGVIWAAAIVFFVSFAVYKSRSLLDNTKIIQIALLSVLMVPYLLPKMHERYFFAADILSIVFGFYFPRYFIVPILIIGVSFLSYCPYLFAGTVVSFSTLSFVLLAVIIALLYQLASQLSFTKE